LTGCCAPHSLGQVQMTKIDVSSWSLDSPRVGLASRRVLAS